MISARRGVPSPAGWSPVAANRMTKSDSSAWLMKCFVPVMTQSAPSRTARVRMPRRSEPASGSVIARHSTRSPATAGSR